MSASRTAQGAERDPSRAAPWIAAAVSLALAVALTWPAAISPGAVLIGHPGDDVWNHVWGYAWVADRLGEGALPSHTDLLAWPAGGSLYFIDTAQAVALAPLTWLWGAAVAYNAAMILGIAGSAFAAWLLARRVCGAPWPAALAAVIYGASPHLMGQAYNGISETVAAWGFPLALWAAHALLEAPGPRAALRLGLAGAAAALVSWYGGLFAAIGAGVLMLHAVVRAPRVAVRALPWAALAGVLALVAVSPALWAFRETLEAPDALVTRDLDFVTASLTQHNLTDALAMVKPGRVPSPDLKALFGEDLVIIVYLGLVGLGAAALGLARGRRGEVAPWVAIAAVFFVLSLGPYLYWDGQHPLIDGRKIPLPFLPLFDALPLLSRVSHPFRFVQGVGLAVGVLAAVGLARVSRPGPRQAALSLGLCGLERVRDVLAGDPAHTQLRRRDPSDEPGAPGRRGRGARPAHVASEPGARGLPVVPDGAPPAGALGFERADARVVAGEPADGDPAAHRGWRRDLFALVAARAGPGAGRESARRAGARSPRGAREALSAREARRRLSPVDRPPWPTFARSGGGRFGLSPGSCGRAELNWSVRVRWLDSGPGSVR